MSDLPTCLPGSFCLGLHCLVVDWVFRPFFCFDVLFWDKWLLLFLFRYLSFLGVALMFFRRPRLRDLSPLFMFLPLLLSLSVLVSWSSLLSAFASSASLVVLLFVCCGACVVRPLLPSFAWCCFVVFSFSPGGAWGVLLVRFRVLLKRVCGRLRAGCLVCMRFLSLVCRPCLVPFVCVWFRYVYSRAFVVFVCARVCHALRPCEYRLGILGDVVFATRAALAYKSLGSSHCPPASCCYPLNNGRPRCCSC